MILWKSKVPSFWLCRSTGQKPQNWCDFTA